MGYYNILEKAKSHKLTQQKLLIDINCDLGEGQGVDDCQQDSLLMPYISSCNIACGGHAGNQLTILHTLRHAAHYHLKVGAHPGYPDKKNFGRISVVMEPQSLLNSLQKQIKTIENIAAGEKIALQHIKFHGALYNDIETNSELATLLADFCKRFYPKYRIFGLAGGLLEQACNKVSLDFIPEAFIDRRYQKNGKLVPRQTAGAVITNVHNCLQQALSLVTNNQIKTIEGEQLKLKAKTLCLHGDSDNALTIASQLFNCFNKNNIEIQ